MMPTRRSDSSARSCAAFACFFSLSSFSVASSSAVDGERVLLAELHRDVVELGGFVVETNQDAFDLFDLRGSRGFVVTSLLDLIPARVVGLVERHRGHRVREREQQRRGYPRRYRTSRALAVPHGSPHVRTTY